MNKAEILDLALRVEALEGADREVDCLIKQAVGDPWDYAADWGPRDNCKPVGKPYTSSIDAALTLVERGDEWQLSTIYNIARAEVGINRDHQTSWPGRGEHDGCNPVLAILAAALRAIASTMEDDRG